MNPVLYVLIAYYAISIFGIAFIALAALNLTKYLKELKFKFDQKNIIFRQGIKISVSLSMIYLIRIYAFSILDPKIIPFWYYNAFSIFITMAILFLSIQRSIFELLSRIRNFDFLRGGTITSAFVSSALGCSATILYTEVFIAKFAYGTKNAPDKLVPVIFIAFMTTLFLDILPSFEDKFRISKIISNKRKIFQILLTGIASAIGVYGGAGKDDEQLILMASITLGLLSGLLLDPRAFKGKEKLQAAGSRR